MDSEVWASLLSATKRRLALHPYRSDRTLSHDDLEAHDDMQVEFTCPFCCGEFDIGSLCSHIEEEHCFEPKAAVCPVCATKVKNDMVAHITFQHGHLFKMQRRRFRMAVTSVGSTLSSIVKERGVMGLQAHSSSSSYWPASNASHPGTDHLANLLCGLPPSETGDKLTGASVKDKECATHQLTSSTSSMTSEECKQQLEAAALRANFIQQLVLSTVFRNS
eukprot:c22039_g1_i1 orf=175-834(+)